MWEAVLWWGLFAVVGVSLAALVAFWDYRRGPYARSPRQMNSRESWRRRRNNGW